MEWVRDLELSKQKSKFLAYRTRTWFFGCGCQNNCRQKPLRALCELLHKEKPNLLFNELKQDHNLSEWCLFIDSSKDSLKAFLPHNGDKSASIPILHAVNVKETYEIMAALLECIKYKKHQWKVCSALKVVATLCGMQAGYTKYCCFLCLWGSAAIDLHYEIKQFKACFVTAWYGCMFRGLVPLPIELPLSSSDTPPQHVGFLLSSCNISVALTSEACFKGLPKSNTGEIAKLKGWPRLQWFVTEHLQKPPKDFNATNLRVEDSAMAYIEYTTDKEGSVMGMRQTFFKYLNKEKQTKSGSAGGSAKKTWRFMNALNFLKCEATESGGTDNLVMYF